MRIWGVAKSFQSLMRHACFFAWSRSLAKPEKTRLVYPQKRTNWTPKWRFVWKIIFLFISDVRVSSHWQRRFMFFFGQTMWTSPSRPWLRRSNAETPFRWRDRGFWNGCVFIFTMQSYEVQHYTSIDPKLIQIAWKGIIQFSALSFTPIQ